MAITDVGGVKRPGMFETIHDPETDLTFTPIGGRANITTFKASNGQTVEAKTANPEVLGWKASPADFMFSPVLPRRGRK